MRYGKIDREYAMRLATTPPEQDGPIWMVNLMSYRESADYTDGRESAISGKEADDRYAPTGPLKAIGAKPVFFGDVDTQFMDDSVRWDRVGIVKYPTRRSFIEMQSRPDFKELHAHKDAGMAITIVMGSLPIAMPPFAGPVPDWTDVPNPPTADDGPVVFIEVLTFREGQDRAHRMHEDETVRLSGLRGARPLVWFDVEGTIVGDGRSPHQLRFGVFPSRAALMAVVFDPDRVAQEAPQRERQFEDAFALVVRPTIDLLAESVTDL